MIKLQSTEKALKERLTKWDCMVQYITPESEIEKKVSPFGEVFYAGNAIAKLAAYEDTGLTPKRVDALIANCRNFANRLIEDIYNQKKWVENHPYDNAADTEGYINGCECAIMSIKKIAIEYGIKEDL